MNYEGARQRESDGRWDWTNMRDGAIWRSGPCRDHEDGHETQEEAERHFYDNALLTMEETNSSSWHGCAVCDTPTKGWLGNRGLGGAIPETPLCDEHRTVAVIVDIHPFVPGLKLIHW